ncbi:MAG: hypothetical protein KF708_18095 [Pirellulales bacterium]|nr:hypothetical protein [Pirellulales bacterium]
MYQFSWRYRFAPIVFSLLFSASAWVVADEPADPATDVRTLLARPILDEDQSLREVQRYCERRIATLPPQTSWSNWQREAETLRERVLAEIVFRGVPADWRSPARKIEWFDTIAGGPGYKIRKLRYEALPGLWIPALLYEPENLTGRVPVVLNVNGHDSKGKAAPYKQIRCINLAQRGMLALNVEWLNMGQLQGEGFVHYRMNQLDLCGVSGLAPFYLAIERALDLLLDHPHADVDRVAMAGLSGGGWQTILFSALDRRVTLSNPVAGYSSYKTRVQFFSDLGDSEQTPTDLAQLADYTHLTALRAPRPTLLTFNAKDDCCFASGHALPPLLESASPIFERAGVGSRLRSHVNHVPGTHNFERENREAFYQMLGDHFYAGDPAFNAAEIDSESEVKSAEELAVSLPEENLDFHKLAKNLMEGIEDPFSDGPVQPKLTPATLARTARLNDYMPQAELVGEQTLGTTQARFWRIVLAEDWTVPVVELSRGEPKSTALVAADTGRAEMTDQIHRLLDDDQRVLAVDPFYLGESKIEDRGFLFALLVSSVGSRPLGVQADQLQAVSRWASQKFGAPVERLITVGPRIGLSAVVAVAAGDESERPKQLELSTALVSLREIIDNNWSVDKYPELFCFGLFAQGDIHDFIELAKPCQVIYRKSTSPTALEAGD